jgi:threonine dehydrogenase-like Zn-dependent dehydrogenase
MPPMSIADGERQLKELTKGVGADTVLECVGTPEAMQQAIRSTRPGGTSALIARRSSIARCP